MTTLLNLNPFMGAFIATIISVVCTGILALAECDVAVGQECNIGSGREISIEDLAKTIAKILARDINILTDKQRQRPSASEVERLLCDNTKIASLTGWKPGYDLEEGLKETIEWFKDEENLRHYKADVYNI